jgi:hypothetical protein
MALEETPKNPPGTPRLSGAAYRLFFWRKQGNVSFVSSRDAGMVVMKKQST